MILEHSLTPHTHTHTHTHTHKLIMDLRPESKARHYKTPKGKYRQNTLWHKS